MINNNRNKMDESNEKMSTHHGKKVLNPFAMKKPKKRSLIERELETNMTARITSPVTIGDGVSTSRYGRARRVKSGNETGTFESLKSPKSENTPVTQSPTTKLVPNSVHKTETPKKALETSFNNNNPSTYQDRKSLSRFNSPEVLPKSSSSAKKFPKVYIRKDLIQNRDDDDDDVILIKDLFSPKSGKIQNKVLKRSAEKLNLSYTKLNGHIDNASVVKALNFDGNKSKRDLSGNKSKRDLSGNKRKSDGNKDSHNSERDSRKKKRYSDGKKKVDSNKRDLSLNKIDPSISKIESDNTKRDLSGNKINSDDDNKELIGNKGDDGAKKRKESNEIQLIPKTEPSKEEYCPYQVGDLAWARMGTFPFWPCIITKDPESDMFVRKKLFGRVEHNILHVTFFADNGRRSWVVDNMLRKYMGLEEFLSAREKFTTEDKKKDPRLYSAFFISEKKQSLWNTSVDEAETLNREPIDLRIDIFNEMLHQARASKKQQKSGRITRTDSDVSLSESLYDSLFSEDDSKTDDGMRLRNKSRNRSLDVSDVVTACLDNMAAKTGNIKIQRQSHMDRWLQKAKSKTPEKVKTIIEPPKTPILTPKVETVTPTKVTPQINKVVTPKVEVTKEKPVSNNKKKKLPPKEVKITKVYSLRRSYESQNAFCETNNEIDPKNKRKDTSTKEINSDKRNSENNDYTNCPTFNLDKEKVADDSENLDAKVEPNAKTTSTDDSDDILNAINELLEDSSTTEKELQPKPLVAVEQTKENEVKEHDIISEVIVIDQICKNKVEDEDKLAANAEVIFDIPVKTEKDLTGTEVVNSVPVELDCISVITESSPGKAESSIKIMPPSDIKMKEIELKNTCPIYSTTPQTSPLKHSETVSIHENSIMTHEGNNISMTHKEYNTVDLQDHNSNLTNVCTLKSNAADKIEKVMDFNTTTTESETLDLKEKEAETDIVKNKSNDTVLVDTAIEKPVSIMKPDSYMENQDKSVENNDTQTGEIPLITENYDMSIEEVKYEVTTNEKDLLNENGQSASLLQIGDDEKDLLNDSGQSASILQKGDDEKDLLNENGQSASILQKGDGEKDLLTESGQSASILQIGDDEKDLLNESGQSASLLQIGDDEKDLLNESGQSASILQIGDDEKDLLNENGQSASILQIGDDIMCDKDQNEEKQLPLNSNTKPECIQDIRENDKLEVKSDEKKSDVISLTNESSSFLDDCHSIDVKNTVVEKDNYFCKENMNIPPDLTTESKVAKADFLTVQNIDSDYEDSDDEPSPEYEPLGDEITEDFRQHMKCIESNITDKKDEAQLVKVCNEIAILEESKAKLVDVKTSMNKLCNFNLLEDQINIKEQIKSESVCKDTAFKSEKVAYNETINIDLTKTSDDYLSKDTKAEILDGLNIINKAAKNSLKSPLDKKKHKLSLKRSKTENTINTFDHAMNPQYRTIDQIEEIMKNKPTRLPIENGEVYIPEIKENGYHSRVDTPELIDDDFDIEEASVNSEDSEVSLPQEKIPARRSLRARPCKKSGLEDLEFLTYMELRQDDLMEQHPELSMDDIVLYLYKTFAYTQNLKSDVKIEESPVLLKTVKQETPPSKKKSKKTIQPKNTIENFFREKYKNAKKIDFDSERSESFGTSDGGYKNRRIHSISPVDSGIGNSKDSNESDSSIKRHSISKSPQIVLTRDITRGMKVELINDIEDKESIIPRRLRKKTASPKVLEIVNSKMSPKEFEMTMNQRVPVVVISPIKNERLEAIKHHETKTIHATNVEIKEESKDEPSVITKPELDSNIKHENEQKPEFETNDTKTKQEPNEEITGKEVEATHKPDINITCEPEYEAKYKKEIAVDVAAKPEKDYDTESMDSDSELPLRQLRSKVLQENKTNKLKKELLEVNDEVVDTVSVSSDEPLLKLRTKKVDKGIEGSYEDPEFLKYVELKQDNIIDENPLLSQNEIKAYLYKTWIYEKESKSDIQKNDDIESSNLVKGLNQETAPTRKRRKPKTEKFIDAEEIVLKDKPKRKTVSHYYNEAFISDIEDELEVFELFKTKKTSIAAVSKSDSPKKEATSESKIEELKTKKEDVDEEINTLDEVELYFKQLTSSKPSVFKGLIREKVCEICEDISNLIKCKGCNGTFHYDCVKKAMKTVETPTTFRGRKKKRKTGRKPKNQDDSDHSDEKDVSEENISFEEPINESFTIDAATIEAQIEAKMKEILEKEVTLNYDSYSSDEGIDWSDTLPGKCELIDVKLKRRTPPIDYTNFKCNNCQKHSTPVCFVCKSAVSKTDVKIRQKCNVAHCHSYYHRECLNHWPQTQFNAGEWSKSSKKSEQLEALTCPRHVCHTCVSDDPRGCKTRFSGDKLAKCVRCPATYHSFNKCLPAGTQILTASLIICPRHYEHRPGKVPCHVNTGWCFICALGGSLICCEYCPTSFHAECLNIKPPEGNYMCEDCETGRLPLYGEIVWVKLGHYRWWPGVILYPSEIPDNIMAVKHGLGEFVVRFFGQYDHYWVNRGRVFPYQEGDSGRISSQKSKIDVAFTTAMEHAQRAFEILKNAQPDEDESLDIASSLLPPHYVKLKCNKPIGSLLGRKIEDPSLSLTQCECNPAEAEPCGPNSQCINRMLLTECGPTCRAGDRCSNRAFEKRLYPKLTPYKAPHRGWGLKTLEDIKAGQFVIEYVGELIDEEEFQRRMARKHEIRDENFYFLTLDKERMIDAGPKGNLARFMNHCCEPNCETQKWTVLGDVRVGLFAIDDIKANSEVTFNYNLECTGIEKKRCLCGAKRCSGYIGAKPKQLDESQRKKNGLTKRKYTKRKNVESPSTNSVKSKVKKPVGRPPKPKELTEIEKDLLIIKNATVSSDESRCQSADEKPQNTRKKTDFNTTDEASNSSELKFTRKRDSLDDVPANVTESKVKNKIDSNTKQDVLILNGTEGKSLKRKLDLNTIEEVTISNEPSAKRLKCDKQIEVGD